MDHVHEVMSLSTAQVADATKSFAPCAKRHTVPFTFRAEDASWNSGGQNLLDGCAKGPQGDLRRLSIYVCKFSLEKVFTICPSKRQSQRHHRRRIRAIVPCTASVRWAIPGFLNNAGSPPFRALRLPFKFPISESDVYDFGSILLSLPPNSPWHIPSNLSYIHHLLPP